MAGIFGSALGGSSQAAQSPARKAGFWDYLLKGYGGVAEQQALELERAKIAQQMAARQKAAGAVGVIGTPTSTAQIAPIGAFAGSAPETAIARMRTMRDAAPALSEAAGMGVNVSDLVSLADKITPSVEVANGVAYDPRATAPGSRIGVNLQPVNDVLVDPNDPTNANRVIPKAPEGMRVLYDENRNPIFLPIENYEELTSRFAAARAGGEAMGRAPYTPDNRTSPTGAPVYGVLSDRFGGGGGGMLGQSPADASYQGELAKAASERYQAIQAAGQAAGGAIAQYQELGRLLAGVDGNALSQTGVELARFAKGFGLNIDDKLPNKEASAAIANQLALKLRDPSQGAGMPGAMSNADRQFLLNSVPNLMQTSEGRQQMIRIAVAVNERNKQVAEFARKWQQRFGRIDAPDANGMSFDDYLGQWAEQNPMFGR